jgi:hypothetical protein
MDEVPTRNHAEAHAKAVVDGDMDAVVADFVPDLRSKVPELAKALPDPTTEAEVLKCDVGENQSKVEIRYANDDGGLTIRTTWEEVEGRPMIVDAAPAD